VVARTGHRNPDVDDRPIFSIRERWPFDWGLQPEWVTENSIRSASTALVECLSLLKQRNQPFILLNHVHGQTTVQIHAREDDVDSALDEITAALSNDVLWHLGEFSMMPGPND